MHIKQVVLEGFKTYREQTTVDFEPHLNCIGAHTSRVSLPRPPVRASQPSRRVSLLFFPTVGTPAI